MFSKQPKPNRILIIDDDPNGCDILVRRLSKRGYICQSALGGIPGLQALRNQSFDLVLLDCNMPDLSGMEVLQQTRERFQEAELPIIMVTGHTDQEKVLEALECGANDFISKPYNFKILLARIETQLASKLAFDALRNSEQRYVMAMESSDDGLWDWEYQADVIYFSAKWKEMLGIKSTENYLPPELWFSHIHPEELDQLKEKLDLCQNHNKNKFTLEHRICHTDGTYRWVEIKGRAIRDPQGKLLRILGSQRDITENKVKDPLTGLSNRLLFMHRLAFSLNRKKRNPEYQYAVLFLDLDQFKMINDSLGHAVGDLLLQEAANRIEKCVRNVDIVARIEHEHLVARMGGDEFTILLEDLRSANDAIRVAKRISETLKMPFLLEGREVFISTSIGIAWSDGEMKYERPEELLRDADNAMYRAKSEGRGRYELFDQQMHSEAIAQLELETDLRYAVQQQQFCVHYQPILDLEFGEISGFEALVRWDHPEKGLISPLQFIPLAEESGLITEIGMWVFAQACKQLKEWHNLGFKHLDININLSRKQFFATNLTKECRLILEEIGLAPQSVVFEITESCVMVNQGRETQILEELKQLGVRLAMDDFGTGYSSLSILHQLPFDSLKIDRAFIAKMQSDTTEARLVKHIIAIAYDLGLSVTAEGIETIEQMELLQDLGCAYAQGYYFARPLTQADATTLLQSPPPEKWTSTEKGCAPRLTPPPLTQVTEHVPHTLELNRVIH